MDISRRCLLAGLALAPGIAEAATQTRPRGTGAFSASPELDAIVQEAIANDEIPGAVLVVGHKGRIIHRKAYGFRSLEPRRELMTLDTIFDLASLTKVIATTPSIMKLFEDGKIRLNDRVTRYLEDFQGGNSPITVRSLMTHFSGLRPDLDLRPAWSGYDTGVKLALADTPKDPPGIRFTYSDINFLLLGEIVRRISGKPLPEFARANIFLPLGMRTAMFNPPAPLRRRIAPTERVNGRVLRGVVHDTTARYMGGVAGHAGLFACADDLIRFAQMMLGHGALGGKRIFRPPTIEKFTTPQSPPGQPVLRGLGWDMDSELSGNRGELFPIGSYGHTGFTGTSLWIDPVSDTFVILLANSVHPKPRPAITSLRARVATASAAATGVVRPGIAITGYNEALIGAGGRRVVSRNAETLTGLDVLVKENFSRFAKLSIGLITNHTGLDRTGARGVDRMLAAGVKVTALFSPEHGLAGAEDAAIADGKDAATGLPVFSLYGTNRRPTPEMLKGLDALVFDIQDIGARFYTYVTTMAYAMEEAAKHRIPFYVLDRPNPLTGVHVEGPILDADLLSFTGYDSLPLRHGLTVGELARMFNGRRKLGVDLRVVAMQDWNRGDWFDSTGLAWVNPSPNIRSLTAALLYPGVAMLEGSKDYSVGRGTDAPFEHIGADWMSGQKMARELNARFIPGIRFYPTRFAPSAGPFKDKTIEGVRFVVTDREAFSAGRLGIEIAAAIQRLHPGTVKIEENLRLIGNRTTLEMLKAGEDPRSIEEEWREPLKAFGAMTGEYLLYR